MKFLQYLMIVVFFSSCGQFQAIDEINLEEEKLNIIKTDSAFSKASQELGMRQAFLLYSDSSVIELNDGSYPTQGIQEMEKRLGGIDDTKFQLTWVPLKCEVAKSGDLGYTFGNWEIISKNLAGRDSATYGNYISVWKKQKDNSWKIVLDGGNSAPGPSSIRE